MVPASVMCVFWSVIPKEREKIASVCIDVKYMKNTVPDLISLNPSKWAGLESVLGLSHQPVK